VHDGNSRSPGDGDKRRAAHRSVDVALWQRSATAETFEDEANASSTAPASSPTGRSYPRRERAARRASSRAYPDVAADVAAARALSDRGAAPEARPPIVAPRPVPSLFRAVAGARPGHLFPALCGRRRDPAGVARWDSLAAVPSWSPAGSRFALGTDVRCPSVNRTS